MHVKRMHAKRTAGWALVVAALGCGGLLVAPAAAAEQAAPATVNTYAADWDRTWRNGTVRTDTRDVVQGTAAGGRNVAQIGFPTQVYTDLKTAQTVNPSTRIGKVEVWLYFRHWWPASGGAADIGVHANAAKPATFKYSGSLTVSNWKRYTGRWVTLPASWLPGWNSGNTKGITLGGKAGSNPVFYGRGAGATDPFSWARPLIRVTYTAP